MRNIWYINLHSCPIYDRKNRLHRQLGTFGEVADRKGKVTRVRSIDTSRRSIEREGSSEDTESTTGFDNGDVVHELTNHEKHEGDREEKE